MILYTANYSQLVVATHHIDTYHYSDINNIIRSRGQLFGLVRSHATVCE